MFKEIGKFLGTMKKKLLSGKKASVVPDYYLHVPFGYSLINVGPVRVVNEVMSATEVENFSYTCIDKETVAVKILDPLTPANSIKLAQSFVAVNYLICSDMYDAGFPVHKVGAITMLPAIESKSTLNSKYFLRTLDSMSRTERITRFLDKRGFNEAVEEG